MQLPIEKLKVERTDVDNWLQEMEVVHHTLLALGLTYDVSYIGEVGDDNLYFTNVREGY